MHTGVCKMITVQKMISINSNEFIVTTQKSRLALGMNVDIENASIFPIFAFQHPWSWKCGPLLENDHIGKMIVSGILEYIDSTEKKGLR